MLIWPKHVVVGLCCLISGDGSIRHQSGAITIFSSSEEDWVKQIQKVLRSHKIGTSIQGPNPPGSKAFIEKYKSKAKEHFVLGLNKMFPKNIRSGLNQHQVFRNSIEHWGIQDYLMKRKYDVLCKITDSIPLTEEAKIQRSL